MGNNKSSHASTSQEAHHHKHHRHHESDISPLVKQMFLSVSDGGDTLSLPQLQVIFFFAFYLYLFLRLQYKLGDLASPLFKYLSDGDETYSPMTLEQFGKHSQGLVGNSTDIYVKIIQPVDELLKICFECAGVRQPNPDDAFISSLISDMVRRASITSLNYIIIDIQWISI